MTLTTAETITVNGVALNTLAKNVESLTGRLTGPARRTQNLLMPGRHGAIWTPRKRFDQGLITLPMWVKGCDDDGSIPTGSSARKEFYKRIDELTGLFGNQDLLDIRHTLPDGSVRQCFAEVLDVIDMTVVGVSPLALFGVSLNIPSSFWQDLFPLSQGFTGTVDIKQITLFAGGTAPMDDLVYTVVGPITSMRLTDEIAGGDTWFQYNGAIGAGQGMIIDAGQWTLVGTGGYVPDYSLAQHLGDSRWLSLTPSLPNPKIHMTGTGKTAATSLTVAGRRKYMVG